MRSALSGNRDAAAQYQGVARSRLDEMKRLMALGGLEQMMRTLTLPGGVELQVASVFGQDYVSIYVPPVPGENVVETAQDEHDAKKIGRFLEGKFGDLVYARGSGQIDVTLTPEDEFTVVGRSNEFAGPDKIRSWRWSSVTGFRLFAPAGLSITCISPSGGFCGGTLALTPVMVDGRGPYYSRSGAIGDSAGAMQYVMGPNQSTSVSNENKDVYATGVGDSGLAGAVLVSANYWQRTPSVIFYGANYRLLNGAYINASAGTAGPTSAGGRDRNYYGDLGRANGQGSSTNAAIAARVLPDKTTTITFTG